MSFQKYLENLEKQAEDTLNLIPEELCTPIEPQEYKLLRLEKTATEVQDSLNKRDELSPLAASYLNKIAEELSQITLSSRLKPIDDPHYHWLLKKAGVEVPQERNDDLEGVVSSTIKKVASGQELDKTEQILVKHAGLRSWLMGFKPIRQMVGRRAEKKVLEQQMPKQVEELTGKLEQSSGRVKELEKELVRAKSSAKPVAEETAKKPTTLIGLASNPYALAAGIPTVGGAGYMMGRPSSKQQQPAYNPNMYYGFQGR
jgi:hypothetical protein